MLYATLFHKRIKIYTLYQLHVCIYMIYIMNMYGVYVCEYV